MWRTKRKPLLSLSSGGNLNILRRSENIAFRLISKRATEDHSGCHGSKTTPWWTPQKFRGRSAEDPRGRPPRKSWIQKHTGPPASKFWRQATAEDPRKTPRKSFGATGSISSCGACLPALWASGGSTGWRATGWPPGGGPPGGHQSQKNSFACTVEDPWRPPRKS